MVSTVLVKEDWCTTPLGQSQGQSASASGFHQLCGQSPPGGVLVCICLVCVESDMGGNTVVIGGVPLDFRCTERPYKLSCA
jgi:hypothetical protein